MTYFVWSSTACLQVSSLPTYLHNILSVLSTGGGGVEVGARSDVHFTHISALFTLSSEQINPHLFQVSLSLVSVYHCAFADCIITRFQVLEGKLSMKRLKRSRGGEGDGKQGN